MKREFIEELGLRGEAVEAVMREYGKGIEAAKASESERAEKAEKNLAEVKRLLSGIRESLIRSGKAEHIEKRLMECGMVSRLAAGYAAEKLLDGENADSICENDAEFAGFVEKMRGLDPEAFELKHPDRDKLPRFSRPAERNGEDSACGLYENGVPVYSYVRMPSDRR